MPDDEPLDDARQVATAAAAAAARVVETMAREARDQTANHRAALERAQDQQRARDTVSALRDSPLTATRPAYDTPERRHTTDTALRQAGVSAEARTAHTTADLLNGTDPAQAAARGTAGKATKRTPGTQPARQASRTR